MIRNKPNYGEIVGESQGRPVSFNDNFMKFLDEIVRKLNELESLGGAVSSGNTNPLLLPRYSVASNALYAGNTPTAYGNLSTGVGFWSIIEDHGAVLESTNAVAGEYREIVNVNGSGYLTGIIGPMVATSNDTVRFRVTIDGTPYETPDFIMSPNSRRTYIGSLMAISIGTGAGIEGFTFLEESTEGARDIEAGSITYRQMIPEPSTIALKGVSARFDESLVVEVMASGDLQGSHQGKAGVLYVA
jgi:hypothetical protein